MSLTIVVVQSVITGGWNYCPQHAVPLLRPDLSDKQGWPTAAEAVAAAKADRTIPQPATFKVAQ